MGLVIPYNGEVPSDSFLDPITNMPIEKITRLCFGASYAVALLLELIQLVWPRWGQRFIGLAFGIAGLLAHSLFLAWNQPSLATQFGSMLFLAWILAVFYLYGAIHHRKLAWAIFVLPLVLGLVLLSGPLPRPGVVERSWLTSWGLLHGSLLMFAAVGVCVGFVASVMYLVQVRQLKAKVPPGQALRLFSLERLEEMNRRAINLAFPLLTAGVIVGLALLIHGDSVSGDWAAPKTIGTGVLWLAFLLVLFLRYGVHLRGRQLALLTIVVFALMVFTLASSHPMVQGGSE